MKGEWLKMKEVNLIIKDGINLIDVTLEISQNDNNRICVYKENVLVTSIDIDKYKLEFVTDNIYRIIEK